MIVKYDNISTIGRWLKRKPKERIWIQLRDYKISSASTDRHICTLYKHDNETEYNKFMNSYNNILNKSEIYGCGK